MGQFLEGGRKPLKITCVARIAKHMCISRLAANMALPMHTWWNKIALASPIWKKIFLSDNLKRVQDAEFVLGFLFHCPQNCPGTAF